MFCVGKRTSRRLNTKLRILRAYRVPFVGEILRGVTKAGAPFRTRLCFMGGIRVPRLH